jgi:hypothetical protein
MDKPPKPYFPETVDQAVDDIIGELTLQDKIAMANLDEGQMPLFERLLAEYIGRKLETWSVNQSLMEDCLKRVGDKSFGPAEAPTVILRELWERLRKTHKLRIVK